MKIGEIVVDLIVQEFIGWDKRALHFGLDGLVTGGCSPWNFEVVLDGVQLGDIEIAFAAFIYVLFDELPLHHW